MEKSDNVKNYSFRNVVKKEKLFFLSLMAIVISYYGISYGFEKYFIYLEKKDEYFFKKETVILNQKFWQEPRSINKNELNVITVNETDIFKKIIDEIKREKKISHSDIVALKDYYHIKGFNPEYGISGQDLDNLANAIVKLINLNNYYSFNNVSEIGFQENFNNLKALSELHRVLCLRFFRFNLEQYAIAFPSLKAFSGLSFEEYVNITKFESDIEKSGNGYLFISGGDTLKNKYDLAFPNNGNRISVYPYLQRNMSYLNKYIKYMNKDEVKK